LDTAIKNGNLDTTTALIYDAVHLFALALHELNMIQDININSLDCTGEKSWEHGSSLINYMKLTTFNGLSGMIQFDSQGLRTNFGLDVLELQMTGLEPIGTWSVIDSLNLTRMVEVSLATNPYNVMANKTYVVTSVEAAPYTLLRESPNKLNGNNRFEGYGIDLMTEIAKFLQFNVTFKLVDDGKYGGTDEHGNWNGMINEVMVGVEEGGADFAIADLSVTSARNDAVQFSVPWMNLGISIIFVKPKKAPPSLLSFLQPFTIEVWLYVGFGYVFVSLVLFVLARFSPYEWDNPYPCIEEPEELENQFSLANSFWFTIGSLMQQGSDVAPISLSTRLLAGMWFFFALIMISSYTANLAAFLTVETLEKPIESAEDLARQTDIKYGVLDGGSTMNFFKTSNLPVFQTMWEFMSGVERPNVMVGSNDEGVEKVVEMDGKYAYMMESSSIQYLIERNCLVTQIGGNLDNKGYGIAMAHGTPYKPLIDSAILHLQEGGVLHKLRVKWWKQKRGGGACVAGAGGGGVSSLNLPNVAGVFLVTVAGCIAASFLAVLEFIIGTKQQSEEMGTSWITEAMEEMRFALQCYGSSKTVRKPLKESPSASSKSSSSSSSSSSSASDHKSSCSNIKKRRGKKSLPPSPVPRPASPVPSSVATENPYARSNASNDPYGESGYGRQTDTKSPGLDIYGKNGNPFESDKE